MRWSCVNLTERKVDGTNEIKLLHIIKNDDSKTEDKKNFKL